MAISVTPEGNVNLVKCPLENDYKNTFTFASATDQINYFHSLSGRKLLGSDYTYIKKDNKIRVATPIDEIINYNYLYYVNRGFPTEKRYFCFITRMEYVNENCTDIFIQTDVFQTWYFELSWNRCFVEREHTNNDTIGANTYPEGLETGEYTEQGKITSTTGNCHIVVALTQNPFSDSPISYSFSKQNGIPSGLQYYLCGEGTSVNFLAWCVWKASKTDLSLINSVFLVPDSITKYDEISTVQTNPKHWSYALQEGGLDYAPYYKLTDSTIATYMEDVVIQKPYNNINGYVPRNKKLFVAPYNYLKVDNNSGTCYTYNYEDWQSSTVNFKISGDLTPGCSIRAIPENYKNLSSNNGEGINACKYPIGSWSGDVYTNWLTQNAVNIATNIASATTQTVVGAALTSTGHVISGGSAMAGGIIEIASTLGEIYKHSLIPRQVEGNTNSGDVTYSTGNSNFTFYLTSIKEEMARKIDDYFDMFGYKTCRVKVPNITGRSEWNYIKTIDCNVEGDIPQEDLNTVKEACNKGITFWHNPSNIYNYSLSNNII